MDRTVKDLQSQVERRDKSAQLLTEDLNKSRDKVERLLQTIDELQAADSSAQLTAKRAERELREEKEKSLRLERELESWRGLRGDRASIGRVGSLLLDANSSRRSSSMMTSTIGDIKIDVPERKSSLTKGFL